jgi:hypothetical protein
MKNLLLSFLLTVLASAPLQAAPQCVSLLQRLSPEFVFQSLPAGLREFRTNEVADLSAEQVEKLNNDSLTRLAEYRPPQGPDRVQAISYEDARQLLSALNSNEVTGYAYREKYQRPDVEIGFCFGRATFAHLMLLKMGLQKESIMKAWVVGPMQTPGVMWDFHVATMAYVRGKGWMVLDSNYREPLSVREWYSRSRAQSTDQKLRIYLTPASKFGVDAGTYSRVQMGLDLPREQDWYQHYFVDMMRSLSNRTPEQLGLRRLRPQNIRTIREVPGTLWRWFFNN